MNRKAQQDESPTTRPARRAALDKPVMPPHLLRTLRMLRGGKTQREIAAELGISSNTIHEYVQDIYRRFGVRSRVQLLSQMLRVRKLSAAAWVALPLVGLM